MGQSSRRFSEDFRRPLVKSVDEGLEGLVGERGSRAIYAYLEKYYSITRENLPSKLDELTLALERIFGFSGRTVGRVLLNWKYSAGRQVDENLTSDFSHIENTTA